MSQADKKYFKLDSLHKDSFANVTLDNPTGQPPPPPRTKANDNNLPIEQQLLRDLDRASRLGLPATNGMLRIYGGGEGMTAQQALSRAAGLSLQVIQIGMMGLGFVPGAGVLAQGMQLGLIFNSLGEGDLQGAAWGVVGFVARVSPCGRGMLVQGLLRGTNLALAAFNVSSAVQNFRSGNGVEGAMNLIGAGFDLLGMFRSCFTGEMLIDAEACKKRADSITVGDRVWSRDEFNPDGPLALKEVEEVFVRVAPILNLHVDGQIIRTTAEHPFWVPEKGWVPAAFLEIGDNLTARDGRLVPVAGVADSGQVETVYNWRVADYHTYFVSGSADGTSLWAHNYKRSRGKNGRFKAEKAAPGGRHSRASEYPHDFRKDVRKEVIERQTRVIKGRRIIVDDNGEQVRRKELSIEHRTPVVEHWRQEGRSQTRAQRNDWFNDSENLTVMRRRQNSREGARRAAAGAIFEQSTGPGYSRT